MGDFNLAAICESDDDPLGRAPGAALWPERFSAKHLAHKKYEIGSGGLHDFVSGTAGGRGRDHFQARQFRSYAAATPIKRTIVSLDSVLKTGQQNDFSAISGLGRSAERDFICSRVERAKWDFRN